MFKQLKALISRKDKFIIQTHDNPDHDAVATAYALQQLLIKFSLRGEICYGGNIQSDALGAAMQRMKIFIKHIGKTTITDNTQIIYVDGCKENSNTTSSMGSSIAVIDHHGASLPFQSQYQYADIRVEYGACSSILTEYYQEAGLLPMPNVATALMMGIMMDTAYLTRGVNSTDLAAIEYLYPQADWYNGSKLLRNSLTITDISLFDEAFKSRIINGNFCFIRLQSDAAPDSVGLLADFFLNIREIDFVVVVHPHGEYYKVSVRSDKEELSAHEVLQAAIHDIGSGGGHGHMAGGLVLKKYASDITLLNSRFLQLINE